MSYELWKFADSGFSPRPYLLIDLATYKCSSVSTSISEAFATFGDGSVVAHHLTDDARQFYIITSISDLDEFRNNNPELFL